MGIEHSYRKLKKIRHQIVSPINEFFQDSRAVGIILIICTAASLIISNSSWADGYFAFWHTETHAPVEGLHLPHTFLHWINDGAMVFFFFLVGLEIKRELFAGELSSIRKSMMPILSALGGMVFPALIFICFNIGTPFEHGWGIPMATDIAFSLGILSLLGDRVPAPLKIFLAALAIIDDLGAIITIAIFYTAELKTYYLILAIIAFIVLLVLNLFNVKRFYLYCIPGVILWYAVYNSGIHATIAGVLMAFAIPLQRIESLEHSFYDPVYFIIMPLFALANTAIHLPQNLLGAFESSISHGVMLGLVLGKPLGICLFAFLAVKLGIAKLPSQSNWSHIIGIGLIAGIGFTMSIFISTLAYGEDDLQIISKISVLAASVVAGVAGYCYLRWAKSNKNRLAKR